MDSSYYTKAKKVAASIARHPRVLFPYLKYLPTWGKGPIDYELPWISFPAINFIKRHLRPWHNVFEYGSGGSTLWFARNSNSVLSVESDSDWHNQVCSRLTSRGIKNASCELHPISGDSPSAFQSDSFFRRIEVSTWDVILVDCYCGFSASRYGLTRPYALEIALHHLRPGGIVILDDSWMFKSSLEPKAGWRVEDFIGLGPCRYGVTSTAVFERLF